MLKDFAALIALYVKEKVPIIVEQVINSSASKKELEDLSIKCKKAINAAKKIKPIKGDKGDKGDKGNGIIDATIENNRLIIATDDKKIDAGEVGKKYYSSFGFSYTNDAPMPFKVGGLKKGTRFRNVELKNLVTRLLYGVELPSFASFHIEGLDDSVEVGYTVAANTYKAHFVIDNPELLYENSIQISQDGNMLLEDLENVSPVDIELAEIVNDEPTSTTMTISAFDTTGTSLSAEYSVYFKYAVYYGEYGADIDDNNLDNPLSILRAKELTNGIVDEEYYYIDLENLPAADGYRWFCYPAAFGENHVFYDLETDIALIFEDKLELTIKNEYGLEILYYCYRTTNELFNEFTMRVKYGF